MNTKDKLDVMQAFLDGKEIESQVHHPDIWNNLSGEPSWDWVMYTYRIKPQKQLVIPWEHIKPEYKWAALDGDGIVFVYTKEPSFERDSTSWYWNMATVSDCYDLEVLNIDTDDIDWKQSLVQRPEGV